jgi:3-deoxy-D-manno-octulosonate 8-phosphate phosphatase (KDO 8-P phosphatase)
MSESSSLQDRAARIKLLLMDCDGVLTDGHIWIISDEDDQKEFHTRDGLGLELLHSAGLSSGVISGRSSTAVERRARSLGMTYVHLGCNDKLAAFNETLKVAGISNDEVAFIGDDLNDILLMKHSGLAVAVANASAETIGTAHYVTRVAGGYGAVREVIELILKAQNRWEDVASKFLRA